MIERYLTDLDALISASNAIVDVDVIRRDSLLKPIVPRKKHVY